jgi:O-acetyl-ADP-ribose deacetylase (regulator of RNase III)
MSISLVLGDITDFAAEAIVNAANPQLLCGAGVCGAIHNAAGSELAKACAEHVARHGPVETGSAAITPGFALLANYVIHAVGPVWHGGVADEPHLLASAYRVSVGLADSHALSSIAFPSISTGIFGYPVDLAAPVAIRSVADAIAEAQHVHTATFVLYDAATYEVYERALHAG